MMGLRDVATLTPQLPVSLVLHMRSVCDERKPKETGNGEDETAAAADYKGEAESGGEVANMDGEKVAQLFVTHPLLVHGRKFDIRVYVFVRSFQVNVLYEYACKITQRRFNTLSNTPSYISLSILKKQPFEAYMHTLHYARLANKPYHLTSPGRSSLTLLLLCTNPYSNSSSHPHPDSHKTHPSALYPLSLHYQKMHGLTPKLPSLYPPTTLTLRLPRNNRD